MAEERISEFEDRVIKIVQSVKWGEKKKKDHSFGEIRDLINCINISIMERRETKGHKIIRRSCE